MFSNSSAVSRTKSWKKNKTSGNKLRSIVKRGIQFYKASHVGKSPSQSISPNTSSSLNDFVKLFHIKKL